MLSELGRKVHGEKVNKFKSKLKKTQQMKSKKPTAEKKVSKGESESESAQ